MSKQGARRKALAVPSIVSAASAGILLGREGAVVTTKLDKWLGK